MIKEQEEKLLWEAVELAKNSDEVIVVGGLNHVHDVEGKDRTELTLPYHQDRLIQEVLKVNPRAVIVMMAGSPVDMSSWAEQASAIVWSWYAGMEGGTALAEVLLGEVNPSGKLPETFPISLSDAPAHKLGEFGKTDCVTYKDGLYVGYRYYDTFRVKPLFCFGHGLSYTEYEYQNMDVKLVEEADSISVQVEVEIKNIGDMDGAETVQLYIAPKNPSVERPVHELKGFTKVFLKAGEAKKIQIELGKQAFGFYDAEQCSFKAEAGEYELQLGSSAQDIRLRKQLTLTGEYLYS
jgi:beta-glucosidase